MKMGFHILLTIAAFTFTGACVIEPVLSPLEQAAIRLIKAHTEASR